MWRSIRTRLIISYVLVSALAMSLAAALAWGTLDRAFLDVLRENLLAQARRVAQTIEAGESGGLALAPFSGPYSQAANVAPGGRTLVIDEAGVVLLQAPVPGLSEQADADTSAGVFSDRLLANLGLDPLDGPAHLSGVDLLGRPEVASALDGVPDTAVRGYRWTPGRHILYAAYPVRETGGQRGTRSSSGNRIRRDGAAVPSGNTRSDYRTATRPRVSVAAGAHIDWLGHARHHQPPAVRRGQGTPRRDLRRSRRAGNTAG